MISSNQEMIEYLESNGVLKSLRLKSALEYADRKKFVVSHYKDSAYFDFPIEITGGQTISQPSTVAFMLELLDVKNGNNVLDIGAGSGWVSVILSKLVGQNGKVYAFEINKRIGKIGQQNINQFARNNIYYEVIDAKQKWQNYLPYDRIHSAAAFARIPEDLLNTLVINGIIIAPTQDGFIRKITRLNKNNFHEERFYGFSFVPFHN
ncbi:hypothetical protein A3F08_03045 [Candidatus Berkelbacteria bacterium RIFCSPHIGHO2_12_FULL_36_9]|uniref:Protein-L-isoaspartate O-methyltransferase n=1 Tax=Candidatus Berkelbacteria bacterium RIFCSPHIGHO2_12_FULL_36_9 TaxID=1797469 RepID=A0A1F5EGT5_9BACT|nr:MAG: hypothetical protein A3F08_03045 [Candidatus Berkelbacteria bacterium RIFCSPHIGHO2_12_FULL_36_9]